MKKLLMFLSCQGCGLTSLCARQALGFGKSTVLDFSFVSDHREQEEGLHERLAQADLRVFTVKDLEDHAEFFAKSHQIRDIIGRVDPDFIHVQTNWQLALAAKARLVSTSKPRIVYTMHGFRNNSPLMSPIARTIIGSALFLLTDLVIMPSSFVYDRFPVLGGRRALLCLGVDAEYTSHARVSPLRRPRVIVFAGQFRQGKNQEWLIRSAAEYIALTGDSDIRVVLPGDGARYQHCVNLAKALGVSGIVDLPGMCTRAAVLDYYASASCAVIATNSETFGHCIVEPYCLGVPVLSRPVGIAADIVKHGETGWLFKTQRQLTDLLVNTLPDGDSLEKVSKNAFRTRHIFSWDRIRESYEQIVGTLYDSACKMSV